MTANVAQQFRDLSQSKQQTLREQGYVNVPLEFSSSEPMTGHAGAVMVSNYYMASGLAKLLDENVSLDYHGWRYSKDQLMHQLIQMCACGVGCVDRAEQMQGDPVFRHARGMDNDSCAQNLRRFQQRLAEADGAKDLQDTLTAYGSDLVPVSDTLRFVMDLSTQQSWGHQEGVKSGRLGDGRFRNCCSWLVGGEATTQQVLTADFYPGGANGRPLFSEHVDRLMQAARQISGSREVLVEVRCDGGFFSWDNVDHVKNMDHVQYLMPMDMQPGTLNRVQGLSYEPSRLAEIAAREGRKLTHTEKTKKIHYEYAEFIYTSKSSNRTDDRVVVRRRPKPSVDEPQKLLFWNPKYEFSAMTTNHPGTPEEAWLAYDKGGIVEQIIENGKQGCGWAWFAANSFEVNRVSFLLKVLAQNLLRGLQQQVLDRCCSRLQIDTLIRDVIQIPARLVRRGRGWVMKAFCDHPMARVLRRAQLEVLTLALPDPG